MSDRWNNLTAEEKQALMTLDENERILADDPRRPMYDDLAERRYLVACPFTYEIPHWTEYTLDSDIRIEVLQAENAVLRQQVNALSRALATDTPEYERLRDAVGEWIALPHNAPQETVYSIAAQLTTRSVIFINATEAAKAARAGSGDGEAG